MRIALVFLCVLALMWLATPHAQACDLCGCPVVIDASSSFFEPGFSLGASEQFTHFGTLQLDGTPVPNPGGQRLDSSITQLFLTYNVDSRLGLQLNVPYIHRSWRRVRDGRIQDGSASGLGDLSLLARWLVVRKASKRTALTLNLQAGLKLPTGSAGYLAEEQHGDVADNPHEDMTQEQHAAMEDALPSGVHGHDLAFGSGSLDGILAANVFFRQDRLFFAANVQYALRTRGAYGYRFADDFQWNAGPGVYLSEDPNLKLRLNVSGESKGRDNHNGVTVADTGIHSVFVGPQVIGNFGRSFYAQAGVDFPVVRDNTSLQIVPDYRFNAVLNYRF